MPTSPLSALHVEMCGVYFPARTYDAYPFEMPATSMISDRRTPWSPGRISRRNRSGSKTASGWVSSHSRSARLRAAMVAPRRAVAVCRARGEPARLAQALAESAVGHALSGDSGTAFAEAEGVALTRRLGNRHVLENTSALAAFALGDSEPERAFELAREAVELRAPGDHNIACSTPATISKLNGSSKRRSDSRRGVSIVALRPCRLTGHCSGVPGCYNKELPVDQSESRARYSERWSISRRGSPTFRAEHHLASWPRRQPLTAWRKRIRPCRERP